MNDFEDLEMENEENSELVKTLIRTVEEKMLYKLPSMDKRIRGSL